MKKSQFDYSKNQTTHNRTYQTSATESVKTVFHLSKDLLQHSREALRNDMPVVSREVLVAL